MDLSNANAFKIDVKIWYETLCSINDVLVNLKLNVRTFKTDASKCLECFGSIEEGYWKWMPYNFAFGYDLVQAHKEYSGWTTFGVNPLVYCVMFEGI